MKCFCFVSLILYTTAAQDVSIYLVKQNWHTGIVISRTDVDTTIWNGINVFDDYSFVDVGWGDAEFYQHPDYDAGLAIKALFYPTESALRIEGYSMDIKQYALMSERSVMLRISRSQIDSLCSFISSAYYRSEGKHEVLSERGGGRIIFYKANGKYHALNTCNTWIADALNHSGIEVKGPILTAEDLFFKIQKHSVIIK